MVYLGWLVNLPCDVGVFTDKKPVPWFIWVGLYNLPCDVGVSADIKPIPWFVRAGLYNI